VGVQEINERVRCPIPVIAMKIEKKTARGGVASHGDDVRAISTTSWWHRGTDKSREWGLSAEQSRYRWSKKRCVHSSAARGAKPVIVASTDAGLGMSEFPGRPGRGRSGKRAKQACSSGRRGDALRRDQQSGLPGADLSPPWRGSWRTTEQGSLAVPRLQHDAAPRRRPLTSAPPP